MKTKPLIVSILYGLGLILAALWLLAGGPAMPVYADTFTVTTTAETGPGSLRQAILDANDNPGHDVINFGVTGTISPWSLPAIDDDLTITGPGATQLAVSGGNARRVFEIAGGTTVTITGLTIRDGYVEGNGAGIWSSGSLHLDGVHIIHNVAEGTAPNGYGGGVYVDEGSVTLNETQVLSNSASSLGGGVYIDEGSVTLNETQVLSNAAPYGGGMYVASGSAMLSRAQVNGNTAGLYGGGVYAASGNATLSETQVLGNLAARGGGVYVDFGSATLSETQILSNSASSLGGGVYVAYGSAILNMSGGMIAGNAAALYGGGMYVDIGIAILSETQVLSNSAPGSYGGGMYVASGNATLSKAQVGGNSAPHGGGMYVNGGSATLNETQVFSNSGSLGGGMYVDGGSATLAGTQVLSNAASSLGGGVYVDESDATLHVSGGMVAGNAASSNGGGVYVNAGAATLSETQVLGNAAENGGGLFSNGGYVTLTHALVTGNRATGDGGGICALDGFVTLTGTQVLSNAAGSEGGGVFIWEGLTTIDHTQLSHNAASTGGAGVTVYHGTATLNDSQVLSNTAPYGGGVFGAGGDTFLNRTQVFENSGHQGGGISIYQGNVILNETHVFSNSAGNGGGVYIDQHPAMLTMNGGEIRSNTAITSGGGVYMLQGRIALSETQMFGNLASDSGGGMYVNFGDATLNGTQVLSNTANQGGGVFIAKNSAALNANHGEISHNVAADSGGGVFAYDGSVTMTKTQILSNSASNNGGGMYLIDANATLTGTQMSYNSASNNGGGMHLVYGGATLTEIQMHHNAASGNGGGIYVESIEATLGMAGDDITHNAAYDGGGVYIRSDANLAATSRNGVNAVQGKARLDDVTISYNTASHSGGGMYIYQNTSILDMNWGEISSNTAAADGGGVFVNAGSARLVEAPLIGNIAGGSGGGGYVAEGSLSMGGTPVFSNSAYYGGGLYVGNGDAWLDSAQIQHNTADYGGGMAVQYGHARLERTQMSDNEAVFYGGGLYVYEGSATLDEMHIAGNDAPDGSALYTGGVITPTTALTITGDVYQAGGRFTGSEHDLRIVGALVLAGGDFYAPDEPNTLTLTGLYTHTGGTYYQTRTVDGDSNVGFPKEGGLFINANNGSLGSTQVADTAGDDCVGVTPGEAVQHCYVITPDLTSSGDDDITTTLTFYYRNDEAKPGHDCSVMEAYRWNGAWDTMLTRDESYGDGGRMCGNDPQSIRITGVLAFPTFALRGPAPEIDVAPSALDFGDQDVDAGPALSQAVTITNTGLEDLHVSGMALTGDYAADFAVTGGGEAVTLMTGQTHTVQVAFDPAGIGVKTAALNIQSDDADEPVVSVALAGTGTSTATTFLLTVSKAGAGTGEVSSTPAGINCGAACQATFIESTVVTLTAMPGTASVFAGWSGEGCSGAGICRVTMDAARNVVATFDVAPGYPGYGSTPTPGSTINVGITGIGVLISTTMTIYETGDETLVVTPTIMEGAETEYFDFDPSTLSIPDGGAARELTLVCRPSITGTLAATLTVAHNAPGSPAVYPLRCTGGAVRTVYLPLVVKH